jgi:hypothetical protein
MFMKKITIKGNKSHYMLKPDKKMANGSYEKIFHVQKNNFNEKIKLNFSYDPIAGQDGTLLNFLVDLQFYDKKNKIYKYDISNFAPWLDAGGHAIILSNPKHHMPHHHFSSNIKSSPLVMKGFAHMHSVMPPENSESIFLFSFYDTNILHRGLNKIWMQFRYKNEVLKLPVIFEY